MGDRIVPEADRNVACRGRLPEGTMSDMKTALLVIDAQESFRVRADWAETHNPAVIDRIVQLAEAARERDEPVYWVLHSEPGSGGVFDPALGHVRLMAELQPGDEPVIVKTTINAFTSTDLEQRLRAAGVERIVICGIRTEQCVETTTRVASDLGFEVAFVVDATTTTAIGDLSAAAIVERTAAVLEAREFAKVVTTADVVAGTPAVR
jgi:nicotinamidase-related amidase